MTRSSTATVQTPGAAAALASPGGDEGKDARIAALEAKLAELQAPALPAVVFEPITKHGAERLALSPTGTLTVAEVMAKIDAGELAEPQTNYLCCDGFYARRGRQV